MSLLTVGVLKAAVGQADKRLPIHPDHIAGIDPDLRNHLFLEVGYGEDFGVADRQLDALIGGFMTREKLIDQADVLMVVEPSLGDLSHMHSGQVLWGWANGQPEISKAADLLGLTVIDCADMNHWATDGSFVAPVFHSNSELAGYASVLQALTLRGLTGQFGVHLTAVVLGLGNVAKGAIRSLEGLGVQDITVLTLANGAPRSSQLGGLTIGRMQRRDDDAKRAIVMEEGRSVCVAEIVGRYDVIVNCFTQDLEQPLEFVDNEEIDYFPAGRLIIDVSPATGVGFEWAYPTPVGEPMVEVGSGVNYYGGNGSQAFLWNSATSGISQDLLTFLRPVMRGPGAWESERTLEQAILGRHPQHE